MKSPILVTGGTGTLGRHVVPRLRDAGCDVRVLSRTRHAPAHGVEFVTADLATGEGIEAAVAGVETVVHCAGTAKGDEDKARNLMRAAARASVRHLVYISVVGAGEVAARLVDLTLGQPAGLVPDVAGPRVYEMPDLVRGYLRARHKHRLLVPVPLPGKAARAFRAGANLAPERAVGHRTWEDFLAERVSDSRSRPPWRPATGASRGP